MTTKSLKSLLFLIVFGLSVGSLSGCATDEKDATTPDGLFSIAREYEDAERYDVALQKYADVRNKFPYSSYATSAELAVADVHYKRESYPEAQIAYQNFRDLHPRHPRIDYVIYKTAMSFYQQLPDSVDRDLTVAQDAIYHFDEVIRSFPNSVHVTESRERRTKTYEMLAGKEIYIADFYLKQKKFEASLSRYENVLSKYAGYGYDSKALLGAARAASKVNNNEKQKKYATILQSKFAESDEAKALKTEGL